ncbi:hypothetical protein [Paractinoplanes rishiriensis]|uniref:Uncharacterized protein n=1 Tax=Paractinoplanes rishiriensis TaxID=1050105 RepID=A0A919JX80_9ACTN|nr:hypothetical protein [Actinoplanes rishiriensis]GIE95294.1 hypothetical protein Ari01nite_27590 [Actinoplanes rishiriensis]
MRPLGVTAASTTVARGFCESRQAQLASGTSIELAAEAGELVVTTGAVRAMPPTKSPLPDVYTWMYFPPMQRLIDGAARHRNEAAFCCLSRGAAGDRP